MRTHARTPAHPHSTTRPLSRLLARAAPCPCRTLQVADLEPSPPTLPLNSGGKLSNTKPYSGGLWYDSEAQQFRLYYLCQLPNGTATRKEPWLRLHVHSWTAGLCLAFSADGMTNWTKPPLNAAVAGTNIVIDEISDGITVFRNDEETGPNRWVAAAVAEKNECMAFTLYSSGDGIHFTERVSKSGPTLDRSTIFYNPFRAVWVASIKDNFGSAHDGKQRRARSYYETKDLLTDSNWTHHGSSCPGKANCPFAWVSSDTADPNNPDCGDCFVSEMYNVDALAYESIMIGLFSVFRGFGGGGNRVTGELNEVHAGYSRDGFHYYRPLNANGGPRAALMPFSYPAKLFPHTDVQSVANGMVVHDDLIYLYGMGRTGQPLWTPGHSPGGNRSMAVATLRRDGFVSLETDDAGTPSEVLTHPVVFNQDQAYLFVNAQVAKGGFFQVALVTPNSTIASPSVVQGFAANASFVTDAHDATLSQPNQCVSSEIDATRARVRWAATTDDMANVAGSPIRLLFKMSGVSLYSFWVSSSLCGASLGYLGASGRDDAC